MDCWEYDEEIEVSGNSPREKDGYGRGTACWGMSYGEELARTSKPTGKEKRKRESGYVKWKNISEVSFNEMKIGVRMWTEKIRNTGIYNENEWREEVKNGLKEKYQSKNEMNKKGIKMSKKKKYNECYKTRSPISS